MGEGQQGRVQIRGVVYMERPIEPNMGPSLAVFCVHLKVLMQGFLHFLTGNFCPESNSSSPTAFSHKRNPASSGQHRVENKTRSLYFLYVPYFEDYVNTVVIVHISNTEIEVK